MKQSLSFSHFLTCLIFCLLLTSIGSAQVGIDGAGFGSSDGVTGVLIDTKTAANTLETLRFDVEFIDTPPSEAFTHIGEVLEGAGLDPLNIVYSRGADDIALPAMRLRQITFLQFVSFINRIGGERAMASGGGMADAGFGMASGSGAEGGGMGFSTVASDFPPHSGPRFGLSEEQGIWYFWVEETAKNSKPDGGVDGGDMDMEGGGGEVKSALETMVFALDGETEIVLGLIEEAIAETRRHLDRPEPSLKFHEPSSTLIVTATIEDLRMIEEVLRVMDNRLEMERKVERELAGSRLADENRILRERLSELVSAEAERKKAVSAAEEKVKYLQRELDVARDSYDDEHPAILNLKKQLARGA